MVLPCLSALIVFNVADDLGNRRILSRLFLFPTGVIAVFVASILLIEASPDILTYASYLDLIWGALVVWLGYAVLRRRGTFVIRAARENFRAWCVGTFMMGMVFGALWINYFTRSDVAITEIYNGIFFGVGLPTTLFHTALYALGLGLTTAAVGLATFVAARALTNVLQDNRAKVKLISGGLILLVGAYLVSSDFYYILLNRGYI